MRRGDTFAAAALAFAFVIALGTKSIAVTSQPCWVMNTALVPVPQPRSRALPGVRAWGPSMSALSSGGGTPESHGVNPNRYMRSEERRVGKEGRVGCAER